MTCYLLTPRLLAPSQVVEVIAKHPCLRGHGASNDAQCLADLLEIVIDLRIRHGPGVAPSALSPHADEFLHSASAARVPGPSALRGRGRGGARQPAARGVGRGRGRGSGRGGARLGPRTPAPVDASAMTAGRVTFSGHLDPAYLMRIVRNGLDAPPGAMTVVGEDEEAKRRAVGRVTRLIRTDYLATFADWVLRLHGAVPRAAEWDTSTGDWTAMSHMALTRGGHQRGVPLRLCDFKLRCVPLRQGSPAAQEGAVQDVDTIEREQWCKFYFTVDGERPGRGRQDCKGCSHCINVAPFFAPGDSVRLLRVTKAGQSSAPGSTCGGSASPDGRGGTSQAQGGDHVIDLGAFLDEVDAAFDRVREAHPYYGGRRMKDEVRRACEK